MMVSPGTTLLFESGIFNLQEQGQYSFPDRARCLSTKIPPVCAIAFYLQYAWKDRLTREMTPE